MDIIGLILTKLLELLIGMGNWGVFLSAIGIFPTEIIMAVLAAEEGTNIFLIALASGLGEMVGAYPMYIIGRILSGNNIYKWLEGKGKFLKIDQKKFEESKKKIAKQSYTYIFTSRFVPYLRIVTSLAAGFLEMNAFKFSTATLGGSFIYSVIIAYLGYRVGGDLETIKMYMSKFNTWVTPIILIYIFGSIILKYRKEIKGFIKPSIKSQSEEKKK